MADWLTLVRPRQWSKNLLLYAAFLFTAGDAWGPDAPGEGVMLFLRATLAIVAFSLLSSAGYVLNDAQDMEHDRLHPRKRHRPIAAGRVPARQAAVGAGALVAGGLLLAAPLGIGFMLVATVYLAGATAYTAGLKRIAGLDIAAVAGLFALRPLAGAVAIDVPASGWILVCTFTGALFVAAVKREQERRLLGETTEAHRAALRPDARWPRVMAAGAALLTAALFTVYTYRAESVPADGSMLLTVPLVVFGLLRYWRVATTHLDHDADEVTFRDRAVFALVVAFVVLSVGILLTRG